MRRMAIVLLGFILAMMAFFICATISNASVPSKNEQREMCVCEMEMDQVAEEMNEEEGKRVLAIIQDANTVVVSGTDAQSLYKDIKQHFSYMVEDCASEETPILLIEANEISVKVWQEFFKLVEKDETISLEEVFWPDSTGEKQGYLVTLIR